MTFRMCCWYEVPRVDPKIGRDSSGRFLQFAIPQEATCPMRTILFEPTPLNCGSTPIVALP